MARKRPGLVSTENRTKLRKLEPESDDTGSVDGLSQPSETQSVPDSSDESELNLDCGNDNVSSADTEGNEGDVEAGMGVSSHAVQKGSLSDDEEDSLFYGNCLPKLGGSEQNAFETLPHDRGVLREMLDKLLSLLKKGSNDVRRKVATRKVLLDQLLVVSCKYYGYNRELANYFLTLLGPTKGVAFFEANDNSRPVTLRTNVLKTRRRDLAQILISRGANVDPIGDWCKAGLIVKESTVPIGATPEYLAGHYMVQAASSFLPVIALDPQPDERVMDLAAAPGGKSTFISQMMRNSGILYANDSNKTRALALTANLHRMGVRNCVVTNLDGRKTGAFVGKLDRVLLDAPCTGSGVIAKDPTIKLKRMPQDFEKQAGLQRELLKTAVELVDANSKNGGIIVYSTCSISVEENEAVINYILKTKNVKLVETGIKFGSPGLTRYEKNRFHPSLSLTRRFYPHANNMDGFFVAKLKKLS
eukprot:Gregarina_sp_Poly_1__467@NODE_1111_length_5059_cov_113_669471_g770_i0_p1_GENE_NODE_1111_length_5059_cov_113_669471_g770_i0NODE_1111_length_5059_cov_113_669471_g770_i0_p1_ORF_typecomplete_len474_score65_98Methyltr_RsmBF/PF01189_17/4_1e61Methyltr_RsmF_N/PF17125_5/9_4e21Met_10/PF02475_16/1_9e05GCD14/PF08704_10/0_00025GCD14/PF08704_10/1_8e03PCMT/PF01135_19/0_00019FtsJ/PF01728_19/0_00081Fibrillarin/PF01269_17/0_036Baculo_E66/PF04850_12/0_37_NODE_1111_length_5059_cov_113_669471_g770_i011182539